MLYRILKSAGLSITPLVVVGLVFAVFAPSASAAGWTVLGGDPLFPGGIPNASQQGRNKFVHDMLSPKGVTAQKRAGLDAKERQALKQALVHGEFRNCRLHVGDHFEAMSFGAGAVLVDHNVTFGDPRYSGHGAPAFCLSVEVGKSGIVLKIKVPFKCENFSVENREHHKVRKPKHHPHKCGCRHHHRHHKKHKRPTCQSKGMVGTIGNCVNQSNGQEECEAKGNNWRWEGNQCVQVNVVCGNVVVGSGNTNITQGPNCPVTVINPPPPPTPPCGCEPPPPPPCECTPEEPKKPEPPVVEWERIQEVYTNHERNLCVTVTPTSVVSNVQFAVVDGERSNGGVGQYNASTNKYCVTYTAPSEEPSHVCQEEWISAYLPPGTKCDVAHVAVFCSNGAETVKGQMEIPVLKEENQVV